MSELLEKILSKDNMNTAYKRVCANKGAGGVDGVSVEELGDHIKENWESIRNQIRNREYKPQPVKRVEIPKSNGGMRKLGIPTVMDRVIQQGIVQVISPMCEPLFSEWSYGFRPSKSCEMAIRQLLVYLNEGYEWIVDIDLEKFFDNVPQDKLMSLVHDIINDGDTESLIRKYLKAGVMTTQGYEETKRGTPQGGNLSPLLSNIMLNELDKELEARGLRFTRYADDCVIAVKSEWSAKRVMRTVSDWIQRKLGLKVNMTKTHITRPMKLKYLGFGFYKVVLCQEKVQIKCNQFSLFLTKSNLLFLLHSPRCFQDIVPHIHLETNIHNDCEYALYCKMFRCTQKSVYMHVHN